MMAARSLGETANNNGNAITRIATGAIHSTIEMSENMQARLTATQPNQDMIQVVHQPQLFNYAIVVAAVVSVSAVVF